MIISDSTRNFEREIENCVGAVNENIHVKPLNMNSVFEPLINPQSSRSFYSSKLVSENTIPLVNGKLHFLMVIFLLDEEPDRPAFSLKKRDAFLFNNNSI